MTLSWGPPRANSGNLYGTAVQVVVMVNVDDVPVELGGASILEVFSLVSPG